MTYLGNMSIYTYMSDNQRQYVLMRKGGSLIKKLNYMNMTYVTYLGEYLWEMGVFSLYSVNRCCAFYPPPWSLQRRWFVLCLYIFYIYIIWRFCDFLNFITSKVCVIRTWWYMDMIVGFHTKYKYYSFNQYEKGWRLLKGGGVWTPPLGTVSEIMKAMGFL